MSDALEEVTGEVEDLRRRVEERRRTRATDNSKAEDSVRVAQLEAERDTLLAELEAMDDEDRRKHPDAADPVKYAQSLMNAAAGIEPTPEEKKAAAEEEAADEAIAEANEKRAEDKGASKDAAPVKATPATKSDRS